MAAVPARKHAVVCNMMQVVRLLNACACTMFALAQRLRADAQPHIIRCTHTHVATVCPYLMPGKRPAPSLSLVCLTRILQFFGGANSASASIPPGEKYSTAPSNNKMITAAMRLQRVVQQPHPLRFLFLFPLSSSQSSLLACLPLTWNCM